MASPQLRRSEITDRRDPEWDPLLELVGKDLVVDFMWMGELKLSPGGRMQAYKHCDTRRYLHIDNRGNTWEYWGGEEGFYRRAPKLDALVSVFASLPALGGVTRAQVQRSWNVVEDHCQVHIPRPRELVLSEEDDWE